jgi:hypothetical protein
LHQPIGRQSRPLRQTWPPVLAQIVTVVLLLSACLIMTQGADAALSPTTHSLLPVMFPNPLVAPSHRLDRGEKPVRLSAAPNRFPLRSEYRDWHSAPSTDPLCCPYLPPHVPSVSLLLLVVAVDP